MTETEQKQVELLRDVTTVEGPEYIFLNVVELEEKEATDIAATIETVAEIADAAEERGPLGSCGIYHNPLLKNGEQKACNRCNDKRLCAALQKRR
jgi:hypothetical protein